MIQHCLALDLKNDPGLIAEYENHHRAIWPAVKQSIFDSGIQSMAIYRTGNRLFMILEVDDQFSFEMKKQSDEVNPAVQAWEALMWQYQQGPPSAAPGEKWVLMDKIFEISQPA